MFYENFSMYCKKIGKSESAVAKEIGRDSKTVTGWKKGAVPYNSTLKKLADYFGVTVEDMLADKKEPAGPERLDGRKKEAIELMNDLEPEELDAFLTLLRSKAKK